MNMFMFDQEPNCTVFAQLNSKAGQLNGVDYVKFYARVEFYFMLLGAATGKMLGWKIPEGKELIQIQWGNDMLVIRDGQDAELADIRFVEWLFERGMR